MKHVLYKGDFAGYDSMARQGDAWSVEIWRIGGEAPAEVGELTFDGDAPAEISHENRAKHEPVCGSSCTLQIISPSDRTYIGLYTIEAATVGVTIRRDGAVYWVGTLDPEFYEEPYQCAEGYTVSLTFTDLGVLDRLKYEGTGMRSIRDIITECAERAGLTPELSINTSLMSLCRELRSGEELPNMATKALIPLPGDFITKLPRPGGTVQPGNTYRPASLSEIFVRSDNFFDDDGEASTLSEVLEGMLQPLALRIEQRAGQLWIYDLNGLYLYGERREVEWSGDSQTLGVDEVKNNAVISWSPYADTDKLLPEECWPEDIETDPNVVNLDNISPKWVGDCAVHTYHLTQDLEVWGDEDSDPRQDIPGQYWQQGLVYGAVTSTPDHTDAGFSLWLTRRSRNVEIPLSPVIAPGETERRPSWNVFKIVPHFDGQESEGIALRYPSVKIAESVKTVGNDNFFGPTRYVISRNVERVRWGVANFAFSDKSAVPAMLFRTKEASLPPMGSGEANIKITMEMLFDVRFNPFESAVNFKHPYQLADREKNWQARFNFLYVPVRIYYRQTGGEGRTFIYHKAFPGMTKVKGSMVTLDETMKGYWIDLTVAGASDVTYLAYYDPDGRDDRCGVMGWKTNRQCIPPYSGRLQTAITKGDDGQFIAYPPKEVQGPQGGVLWIEVMSSRWWPMKSRESIDVRRMEFTTPDEWDYIEWVLCKLPQIEIVSTHPLDREISDEDVEYRGVLNPSAKDDIEISTICGTKEGGIPTARGAYFDIDGTQIERMVRAGRVGQVEDLLIGTLYSQYATRHTQLSGEATAKPCGLCAWTERNQPDKYFIMTSQIQNLATCCGDHTFVELSPDEYLRKEESNG